MKIVIDANILIAALIKDSKAREIITSQEFEFLTPEFILEEIRKYREEIKKKANLDQEGFELVMSILFETIKIIPKEDYELSLDKAKEIMNDDVKDVPYVAVQLALNCDGIWTNDQHFKDKRIRLFNARDLMDLSAL